MGRFWQIAVHISLPDIVKRGFWIDEQRSVAIFLSKVMCLGSRHPFRDLLAVSCRIYEVFFALDRDL